MTHTPGEQILHTSEHLSQEHETFLFGDQGTISNKFVNDEIFLTKLELAYAWLASFWSRDIPEEYIEAERIERETLEENNARLKQEAFIAGCDPPQLNPVDEMHPIHHALDNEWRLDDTGRQLGLYNRPILATALLDAYNTLANASDRDDKLRYIIELIYNKDELLWAPIGENDQPRRFPLPIESYGTLSFPDWLADVECQSKEND